MATTTSASIRSTGPENTSCPFSSLTDFIDNAQQRSFRSIDQDSYYCYDTEKNIGNEHHHYIEDIIEGSFNEEVTINVNDYSNMDTSSVASSLTDDAAVAIVDHDDLLAPSTSPSSVILAKKRVLNKYYGKTNNSTSSNKDNSVAPMNGIIKQATAVATCRSNILPTIPTRPRSSSPSCHTLYPPPPFPMANTPSSSCANCGKKGKPLRTLSMCKCCQSPSYWICSPTCTTRDSNRHEKECIRYLELQQLVQVQNEKEQQELDDLPFDESVTKGEEDYILLSSSSARLSIDDIEDSDDEDDEETKEENEFISTPTITSGDVELFEDDIKVETTNEGMMNQRVARQGEDRDDKKEDIDVRMLLWTLCYNQLVYATKKHQQYINAEYVADPPHVRHCEYCFKPTTKLFTNPSFDFELRPCPICLSVRYCSKECQAIDYNTNHYKNNHCCRVIQKQTKTINDSSTSDTVSSTYTCSSDQEAIG